MTNLLAIVCKVPTGYTGHAEVYGEGGRKWSESTRIVRLTREDARADAQRLALDIAEQNQEATPRP